MAMEVIAFENEHTASWDRFIHQQPGGTLFHLLGWKRAVERAFGHQSIYLLAQEDGQIQGVLPLFLIKSRLFGKFMVSTPFAVYGGICSSSQEARRLLLKRAEELASEYNIDYMELRNQQPDASQWPLNELYVTFIKPLPANPEECLQNLPRKARAAVRQGIANGLEAEISATGLPEHYHLNAIQMRRLGSPALPLSWFQALAEELDGHWAIMKVNYDQRQVASVLVFFFRDTVLPYYSGSLQEYNRLQTNNFMYLKLMEYGVQKGYKNFDFGRSRKDTGPYRFKKNQGFDPQPLFYQFFLHRADDLPNINPSNPKFNLPKFIWQRMPLSVTKWLGPKLVRGIP